MADDVVLAPAHLVSVPTKFYRKLTRLVKEGRADELKSVIEELHLASLLPTALPPLDEVESHTTIGGDLLLLAAENDHVDTMKVLVDEYGISPLYQGFQRHTALHVAARHGKVRAINFLLSRGVPVDILNGVGDSPLHFAAWQGHMDAIRCLVDQKADVMARDDLGHVPLHEAALGGHIPAIDYFVLNCGVDPNVKNYHDRCPLYKTIVLSHFDAARRLMDLGASVWELAGTIADSADLAHAGPEAKQKVLQMVEQAQRRSIKLTFLLGLLPPPRPCTCACDDPADCICAALEAAEANARSSVSSSSAASASSSSFVSLSPSPPASAASSASSSSSTAAPLSLPDAGASSQSLSSIFSRNDSASTNSQTLESKSTSFSSLSSSLPPPSAGSSTPSAVHASPSSAVLPPSNFHASYTSSSHLTPLTAHEWILPSLASTYPSASAASSRHSAGIHNPLSAQS